MRHVWLLALLVAALFLALPPALVWSMSECQLNADQPAVEECFQNADREMSLYAAVVGAGLLAAVVMHIHRSRWFWLGLAVVAFGPWLTMRG